MAETNSVSDTQALLHSMLQRLKLQTNSENEIHAQSASTQQNHRTAETASEIPVFQCNGSLNNNHEENSLPLKAIPFDTPLSFHSPDLKGETNFHFNQSAKGTEVPSGILESPQPRSPRWGFLNNRSSSKGSFDGNDNGETPKWQWKLRKMSDSSSVPSLQSKDTFLPSSPSLGNQDEVGASKWGDSVQKRWTQKMKERWKDRNRSVEEREQVQKYDHNAKSNHSPNPPHILSNEKHTTTALSEDIGAQDQPIDNGPAAAPLSTSDDISDPIFPLCSINLMEEIFTGQEWAKFLSPDITSQLESSCNTQKQMQTPSHSSKQEQTTLNQWDYEDHNLRMAQSQMNFECQYMDSTQDAFHQRNYFDFSGSPRAELNQSQYKLSDPRFLEKMDQSVSPLKIHEPMKEQLDPYSYNQSTLTEWPVYHPLSSKQSFNQAQEFQLHHTQPENVHEEMLPVMDLPMDRVSLKKEVSLSRKRSHCTERRGSSERGRPDIRDVHESSQSTTSENSAPNLSPASSSSSLTYSTSQDSESSASVETAVKKRRMEDARRVRFAEEVVFLPPLILSEDEDEDEVHDNDINEYNEHNEDCQKEPSTGFSVPRWIATLRNKTKRTPKLKLPHISSSRFRTRKKIYFVK